MRFSLFLIFCLAAAALCADQARFNADMGNTGQFMDTVLKPPLKLKWRYFTGGGFKASPIAFKGRVFCSDRYGQVYALDAETGRLLWKRYYHTATGSYGGYCENAIPLAYGDHLYFYGCPSALHCVRQDDGREIWHYDNIGINTMYRGKYSPVAYGGKVYVATRTTSTAFRVACFGALSGELLWSRVYQGSDNVYVGEALICTLSAPPSVIGYYNAGSLNWCPKSGRTFALTADSGRVLWEDSAYFTKRMTIYDTLVYISACSSGTYSEGALDVHTGRLVRKGTLNSYSNGPAAVDGRYIFVKPYCRDPEFYHFDTWTKVGGCDWSLITSSPTSETGCGAVSLANGYGYFGVGGGGMQGTEFGGRGRGRLGQGIYAFEIPKDTTVKKLKIVWGFKTASNFCSTPVVADGKLYVTTNQEGAVYCFENQ